MLRLVRRSDDDAVFYYRIHSPVLLIGFDHQRPVGMRHLLPGVPDRQHIHAVARAPDGNDYGKDLLKQQCREHAHGTQHSQGDGHAHPPRASLGITSPGSKDPAEPSR